MQRNFFVASIEGYMVCLNKFYLLVDTVITVRPRTLYSCVIFTDFEYGPGLANQPTPLPPGDFAGFKKTVRACVLAVSERINLFRALCD